MFARIAAILLGCCLLAVNGAPTRAGVNFSWQETYAKVLPTATSSGAQGPSALKRVPPLRVGRSQQDIAAPRPRPR
jgi:hypothetical protein